MHAPADHTPSRAALVTGFVTLYLVWGSTYLAIGYVVKSLPPFGSAGVRFIIAGAMLYAATRLMGAARPTRTHWRSAAIVGTLLLLGGNGLVSWAERSVPSGVTALIIGSTPLWMVMLDWRLFRGPKPGVWTWIGLALGFAGVALLVDLSGSRHAADPVGVALLLSACACWSFGSVWSKRLAHPPSTLMACAMQMLAGGAALLIASTFTGEWFRFDPAAVQASSVIGLVYLITVGSIIGFGAFVWLLRHASPAAVSTYAYVNPIVAVFLGWLIGGERLHPRIVLATTLIVGAVVLMTWASRAIAAWRRVTHLAP